MASTLLLLWLLQNLTPDQARGAVGKTVTVCGKVTRGHYASRTRGYPTFLEMGKEFTIVIWGRDRSKFGKSPETAFLNREACATGKIIIYRDTPQVRASKPEQLSMPGMP